MNASGWFYYKNRRLRKFWVQRHGVFFYLPMIRSGENTSNVGWDVFKNWVYVFLTTCLVYYKVAHRCRFWIIWKSPAVMNTAINGYSHRGDQLACSPLNPIISQFNPFHILQNTSLEFQFDLWLVQCVRNVAMHLGYGKVQLKYDGPRWRTGGQVPKVHLLKVMEVMSTSVYTGLNPCVTVCHHISTRLYRSLSA